MAKEKDINIVVKDSNKERINKIFDEVQARASVRTCSYFDVTYAIKELEKKFNIPKKYLKGVKVFCSPHAQNFPSAYKGYPESTYFRLEHNGTGWKVTRIARYEMYHNGEKHYSVTLTDEAKTAILRKYSEFDF